MDCSPFLNWNEKRPVSEHEQGVVFRSLVATLKLHPALDVSLEAKSVKFLESVFFVDGTSVAAFLGCDGRTTDKYSTDFIQSIVVLISSPNRAITTATMKILGSLIWSCSAEVRLALIKAELIPQIINTLNPLSLSFTEAEDLHINLIKIIGSSLRLMTQDALTYLTIEDRNGQPAVHETVLKQVLIPSEKYIWHLCSNRYSIIDGILSLTFMFLLAQL
ncbi:hypothetical protein BLNAU_19154 [Blattamonas nauphoetae]|uniref:Uncharacterized protein n=1 Tax=Blattamonas nauphoetae TaxID=2049346 RepID=A0ABQ9X2L9_9EUKA|nr:hypothetical protein BLNAU_19154 [Blattamonas nauphoetae]